MPSIKLSKANVEAALSGAIAEMGVTAEVSDVAIHPAKGNTEMFAEVYFGGDKAPVIEKKTRAKRTPADTEATKEVDPPSNDGDNPAFFNKNK